MKKRVVAALLALLAPTAALAGALEGSVPANRTSRIYAFTVADPSNCIAAGRPKMTVRTAPEHGKVSFEWSYVPAGKGFRNCAGGRMRAMAVHYTPKAGFRGVDSFSVGYSFDNMAGYRAIGFKARKFIVHVK